METNFLISRYRNMPKIPRYSPDEVYHRLKNFNFRDDNNKYLPYNNYIWDRAAELLPGMVRDYVWLYITENRNNVSVRIIGLIQQKKKKRKLTDNSNWSMEKKLKTLSPIHDCCEYEIFEPGWTDKIYSCIWRHFKLSCPFVYQTPKITRNSDIFLTIKGVCRECLNEIHIYSTEDATDDGIDFHVSTCDTKHIKHNNIIIIYRGKL
ncbi:hypothetical protein PV328_001209 [Microctonus aethiopoides]|uniref:Uncharacterized protein n=1 Tax=Microctonus aethiopoides TaxID=144406 RepID=A0AA39KX93_9HYME|nr:hypothetical protein PV328_001209 [Microctonus aethiopoides]